MTRTITISLGNYLFSLNIFITLAQDKEKGNRTFVPLFNDSTASSLVKTMVKMKTYPQIHIFHFSFRLFDASIFKYFCIYMKYLNRRWNHIY